MSFTVLDYIFFVIILIFALSALIKGFVNEVFGKAAFILGILGAVIFYAEAGKWFIEKIPSETLRNIVGFVLVFVVVFLVLKLVGLLISKLFEVSVLKRLDRILGFFFGVIEGSAIVGFVIFLITIQPFFDPSKLLNDSFVYSIFCKIIASPEFKEVTSNV